MSDLVFVYVVASVVVWPVMCVVMVVVNYFKKPKAGDDSWPESDINI